MGDETRKCYTILMSVFDWNLPQPRYFTEIIELERAMVRGLKELKNINKK